MRVHSVSITMSCRPQAETLMLRRIGLYCHLNTGIAQYPCRREFREMVQVSLPGVLNLSG